MNKILLPTDYSDVAVDAIEYASALFDDNPCEFLVVHSYQLSRSGLSSLRKRYTETKEYRKTESAAREEMRELLKKLNEKHESDPHLYRGFVTARGMPAGILNSVRELQADMVVMATTGASGLKEVFLGSNAVHMIKKLKDCPILLVPAGFEYQPVKNILFVNDFRRNFEPEELRPLNAMARLTNSGVVVLYVNNGEPFSETQKHNREVFMELMSGIRIEEEQMPMDGFLTDIIEDYSRSRNANMLAMIRNKHANLYQLLREPVVKKIAFKTNIPFLVMPEVL